MEKSKIIVPKTEIITPKLTEQEFIIEFRRKLKDMQEWAIKNEFVIAAFLDIKPDGVTPTIGFRKLKQGKTD